MTVPEGELMLGLTWKDLALAAGFALAGTCAALWLRLPDFVVAATTVLALALGVIMMTDRRFHRIPDVISLPLIPLGLAATWALWPDSLTDHLMAIAMGGVAFLAVRWFYRWYRGLEGLGLGDVKLLMAAGAWTGLDYLAPIVLAACLMALAALLLHFGTRGLGRQTRVAFGVWLAPAILAAWLHMATAH